MRDKSYMVFEKPLKLFTHNTVLKVQESMKKTNNLYNNKDFYRDFSVRIKKTKGG